MRWRAERGALPVVGAGLRRGGPELAALYRDATLFVMPSTGEGLGLVFLEAMRAGAVRYLVTAAISFLTIQELQD